MHIGMIGLGRMGLSMPAEPELTNLALVAMQHRIGGHEVRAALKNGGAS